MISAGQVSVPGSAATFLTTVPPGPCNVVIINSSGTIPLYLGASLTSGTAPTLATNGAPIPGGAVVPLAQPVSASASKLYALAGSGTVTTGVIITTGN